MPTNITPELEDVITQIPGWAVADAVTITPLAGLTNTNYLVTVGDERFVLRIGGKSAVRLGIDRELELEALAAAAKAGIAPEIVHYVLPEGHLVTRFIEGQHWTLEAYRSPATLQRLVRTVQRLHALAPIRATFSPFRRIEACAEQSQDLGVPLPKDWLLFVEKMQAVERAQHQDSSPWKRFCHNDLFWVNVLDDGNIWFVDWEFAGVGDLYFDLATLTYAYDSEDTLPQALHEYVLECYFGEVQAENRARLAGMRYVLMFFSAMWGRLQYGMQQEGLIRIVEGFDFLEYSEATFAAMRRTM
jgi:thiamine kinase-like enzyme